MKIILNESQYKKVKGLLKEATNYEVYHYTYGSAIDAAYEYIKKRGYTPDDDDFQSRFGDAFFKPKDGLTRRGSISIYKNDKLQRRAAQIQITNLGQLDRSDSNSPDKFELNMYFN